MALGASALCSLVTGRHQQSEIQNLIHRLYNKGISREYPLKHIGIPILLTEMPALFLVAGSAANKTQTGV